MDEVNDEISKAVFDDTVDANVVGDSKETPKEKAERELDERKSREALISKEQRSKIEILPESVSGLPTEVGELTIKDPSEMGTVEFSVTLELWDTDACVREISFCIDKNAKMDILQQEIKTLWSIEPKYQQIIKADECIRKLNASIFEAGIQDGDVLVVKHADLPWWIEYRDCVELVLKNDEDKKEIAKRAVRHYKRLKKSGFFDVYWQFENYQRRKHGKVARWTDGDVELICKATKQYFSRLHDLKRGSQDTKFVCYFEEPDRGLGGRSTSTLAFVRIHGEDSDSKFYVKCHHFGPKSTSSGRAPDISELYCYKLLELIGVGPKCYIIPPSKTTESKTTAYVATKWEDKFETLEKIIKENSLSADAVVQLVVLQVLLFITDLHKQNCGVYKGTKDAAIVDFAPTDDFELYRDIKRRVLTVWPNIGWKIAYTDVKKLQDDNSWLNIAKVYLDKWNLQEKIELARQELDPTKTLLEELEIVVKEQDLQPSPTDHLNEYIDTLTKNLENLQTILNPVAGGNTAKVDAAAFAVDEVLCAGEEQEYGWDVDDDLALPADIDIETPDGDEFNWPDNSHLVADHVSAGSFESAARLLADQIGVVNVEPFKQLFLSLYAKSRSVYKTLPLSTSNFSYPLRNWEESTGESGLPAVSIQLDELTQRLQGCYRLTTEGKFVDAINKLRQIMLAVPLLVVDSKQKVAEAQQLIEICRKYLVGLLIEIQRRGLPNEPETQLRALELAAYFTHCDLQPPHEILTLRTAVKISFALKQFKMCASFAQRCIELGPKPDVATTMRKALAACERNMTNAHEINYDEHNPFVICSRSFVPLYRGKPQIRCSFCGASFSPDYNGQTCDVCLVSEIGKDVVGLRISTVQSTR